MSTNKSTNSSPSEEDDVTASKVDGLSQMLGLNPKKLEKAKPAKPPANCSEHGHRRKHIAGTLELRHVIYDMYGPDALLSAATVLNFRVQLGLGKTANGQVIRSANAMGDFLGKIGLNLPRLIRNGKMRYAIAFIDSSEEEKAAAQERLHNLSKLEMKALPVA